MLTLPKAYSFFMIFFVLLSLTACDDGSRPGDGDGDGDSDGDGDGDGDADSDGDGDGDGDGDIDCEDDEGCAEDQHCSSGSGVCVDDVCEAGGLRCEANQVLECDARGSEETVVEDCAELSCLEGGICGCTIDEQCDAGEYCGDGSCRLQECAPSSFFCEDGDVFQCDERGVEASLSEECGSLDCESADCVCEENAQCDDDEYCASLICVDDVCAQGELYCTGHSLYQCNEDGSDAILMEECGVLSCSDSGCYCEGGEQCASAEHCSAGICEDDVCPQGTIYCQDNAVIQCSADGAAEMEIQDCGAMVCSLGACSCTTEEHCAEGQHCAGGACVPDVCLRGTVYCQDGDVYQCNDEGTEEVMLEDCGALSCVDASCTCTSDDQCAIDEFCGASGSCLDDLCEASSFFCTGGDVYQCDANGSDSMLFDACGELSCVDGACLCTSDGQCDTTEHCAVDACADDVCVQGELFCDGGDVSQCNSNGSGSTSVQDCEALSCVDGACICTDNDQCPEGEHCALGVCVDDLCPPSSIYCHDDSVWECNAEGSNETELEACGPLVCVTDECICTDNSHCLAEEHCNAEACVSDLCDQGELFCQSDDVYLCNDEGSGSTLDESCGDLVCSVGVCICTDSDQCGALEICTDGECVIDDSTSGVHTTDLEVHGTTGASDVDFSCVTVDSDGQIAALVSPQSQYPDKNLQTHIIHIAPDGSLSFFVHDDDISGYRGTDYTVLDGLTYAPSGDLIVVNDISSHDAYRITPTGDISTVITGDDLATVLGLPSAGNIGSTTELAVDDDENIYYYASSPDAVVKIEPDGTATVLATLSADADIRGMEVSSANDLYLWDAYFSSYHFTRISSTGTVSTWMTDEEIETQVGGSVLIRDIDMDGSGNLLAFDWSSERVLQITPTQIATVEVSEPTVAAVFAGTYYEDAWGISSGVAVEPTGDVLISMDDADNLTRFGRSPESGAELVSNTDLVAMLGQSGFKTYTIAATPDGTVYTWDVTSRSLLLLDGSSTTIVLDHDDVWDADTSGSVFFSFYCQEIDVAPDGRLYMVDADVFAYDPSTEALVHIVSDDTLEAATGESYTDIQAMAVASTGAVYLFDARSDSILEVSADGSTVNVLYSFTSTSTVIAGLELDGSETQLYVMNTHDDELQSIDTATGALTVVVTESTFEALLGTSFYALTMTELPDGDLLIFDSLLFPSLSNPNRIAHVDVSTTMATIALDEDELRSATGSDDPVLLNAIAVDAAGVIYGNDIVSNDVLYWLP